MYEFLRGTVVNISSTHAVLDVGGVGYKVLVASDLEARAPACGEECTLFVSLVIRENAQSLFGFLSGAERDLFESLTAISGIGPKTGLTLVGSVPLEEMHRAVQDKDYGVFCKVPGVGKKTAERLLIDLKGKLPGTVLGAPSSEMAKKIADTPENRQIRDAMSALVNLGYSQAMAQSALERVLAKDENLSLPNLIAAALRECSVRS